MPLSEYFKGSGKKVMRSMKGQYGGERGKRIFYATVNKKKKEGVDVGPTPGMRKKHGV